MGAQLSQTTTETMGKIAPLEFLGRFLAPKDGEQKEKK
jgi:hypothetical protein